MKRLPALRIALLMAGLLCRADPAHGQSFGAPCPAAPEAPAVTAGFTNNPPKYDLDLTSAQLGRFHISTKVSKSPRETFRTGGLTSSLYKPGYNVRYMTMDNPNTGMSCLYINRIDVSVSFSPTVYIAHEFKPGSCRYTDTMRHEQRHVDTTVITIKEYMPKLKADAQRAARAYAVTGPFPTAQAAAMQHKMTENIRQTLAPDIEELDKVHFQRQQAIDTRREYLRATLACPN